MMYLKTKDLTPRKLESIYEIAYLLFGRASIFIVCTIMFLSNYGAIVLFYMIIGETLGTLTKQALIEPSGDMSVTEMDIDLTEYPWYVQVLTSRIFGILIAGFMHLSIIFKRQLEEMKIVSYLLASIVVVFIVLMNSELASQDKELSETVDIGDIFEIKSDYRMITSVNIMIFSYSIQFMVLPAYSELEKRTNERFATVSMISTALYTIAFVTLAIVGVLLFGSDIKSDLLVNLSKRPGAVSVFCRASYIFVLMFHIPYFFFAVKEYMLVMYDEIESRSLSLKLEAKLAHFS